VRFTHQFEFQTAKMRSVPDASLRARAKQSISPHRERMDCFVAFAPRNDGWTQLRDLAATAPEFCLRHLALEVRGCRECRALDAPAALCAVKVKAHKHSHHGHTGTPGIPRAMVLTVSSALSSVTGLVATVPAQCAALSRVDASVGASGPHGFAVRGKTHSSSRHPRPPHPVPRS
jgi:hypothetical protein